MKKTFKVNGMNCNSCAHLIESELKDKVNKIFVSYKDEKTEIDFDENKISEKEIIDKIKELGYEVVENKKEDKNNKEEKVQEKISKIEELLEEIKESKEKVEESSFLERKTSEKEVKEAEEEPEEEIEEKEESDEEEEENEDKDNNKEEKVKDKISFSNKFGWFVMVGSIILFIFILYFFVFKNMQLPDFKIPELGEKTSLFLLFFAGILTGFHCISMCGGFVISYTGKNALQGHKGFKQHFVYGGSKVISYTIIGGIFGLIGGLIAFSVGLRGWVAILAGIFMIFYALSMFGIKFFRKFQFNPKFLTKVASGSNKYKGPYSRPLVTGLLNGLFIACGPLQAMYLYAMGTGSFFSGATSLMAFGLGTLPVMLGFGSLATIISHKTTKKILKISAIIVLILGLIMLNRGLALTGSSLSYDSIKTKIIGTTGESAILKGDIQEVNMEVSAAGYKPNSFVLKKGVPVKWNINVKQLTGCNNPIIVPEYNLNIKLKEGLNVVEFTPEKTGTITFSCWMGMLRGSFIVTETGTASQEEIKASAPAVGGSCGGGGGCGCGG